MIAFLLGTALGVVAGWRRSGLMDALLPVTTFFQAIPYFILALLLLMVFAVDLAPAGRPRLQRRQPHGDPDRGLELGLHRQRVEHALLPAATIVLASIAGWILGMRNMMVTTMDEDYVLVAARQGPAAAGAVMNYAARNALLPSISDFALSSASWSPARS